MKVTLCKIVAICVLSTATISTSIKRNFSNVDTDANLDMISKRTDGAVGGWTNHPIKRPDQCKAINRNSKLRPTDQFLRPVTYPNDPHHYINRSIKVFKGSYTDAFKAHVDLTVFVQDDGKVELFSYTKGHQLLRFPFLVLQATLKQGITLDATQGWYINVHSNNICEHASSLHPDDVTGFMVKYE